MDQRFGLPAPAAIVIVRDPTERRRADRGEALRALFGLTAAEARLVNDLVDGGELAEIAERRRLSVHTVKTQLRSVMAKTATRRQGELIALVLRSAAALD